jgi:hypothetical protein
MATDNIGTRHTLDSILSAGMETLLQNAVLPLRGQRDSLLKWCLAIRTAAAACPRDDAELAARVRKLVREFEEDR